MRRYLTGLLCCFGAIIYVLFYTLENRGASSYFGGTGRTASWRSTRAALSKPWPFVLLGVTSMSVYASPRRRGKKRAVRFR